MHKMQLGKLLLGTVIQKILDTTSQLSNIYHVDFQTLIFYWNYPFVRRLL